jgi:hypothetical protein
LDGGYEYMSGTSMATPYISGLAALFLQYHRMKGTGLGTPRHFERFLMNTATPLHEADQAGMGLTSVLRQGAGLVYPGRVIFNTVTVEPPSINLMHQPAQRTYKVSLMIKNYGDVQKTYNVTHQPALALTLRNIKKPVQEQRPARLMPSVPTITVGPKSAKQLTVDITVPSQSGARDNVFYSGYIVFYAQQDARNDRSSASEVRVPYAGFQGDLKETPIFAPGDPPMLEHSVTKKTYREQNEVVISAMSEKDYVTVLFNVQIPAKVVTVKLVKATLPTQEIATLNNLTFVGPGLTHVKSYSVYTFQGFGYDYREFPDGDYRIVLEAHKPELQQQKSTEKWMSPVIQIRRPSKRQPGL